MCDCPWVSVCCQCWLDLAVLQNMHTQLHLHLIRCSQTVVLRLQELIALSNKAKAGQAGMHVDTTEAYSSKTAAEVPPDAKLTDQEENLLRQFLSPQVC